MKSLEAEYRGVNHGGGRYINLVFKVVGGPVGCLDRRGQMVMSFDDIDRLAKFAAECRARVDEQESLVAQINARNQED